MRVVIISCEPFLNEFLTIANKKLDLAAIVLPIPQLIKDTRIEINGFKNITKLYSYIYLKECLENTYFNLILIALPPGELQDKVLKDLESLKVDSQKVFRIGSIFNAVSRILSLKFEHILNNLLNYNIFATGVSYAWRGIDITSFSMPTLNCSMSSQDLYYDYQIATKLLNNPNAFKYAIIGLSVWSFHYDESKIKGFGGEQHLMLIYYNLLRDMHHYHISCEDIEEIFDINVLHLPPPNNVDMNNLFEYPNSPAMQNFNYPLNVMGARQRAESWNKKSYPDTVAENENIFYKYVELCNKNNIVPIVMIFPVTPIYREFFSKCILDEFYLIIHTFKDKLKFNLIDKFNFDDQMQPQDFNGAQKISKCINEYIMELERKKK